MHRHQRPVRLVQHPDNGVSRHQTPPSHAVQTFSMAVLINAPPLLLRLQLSLLSLSPAIGTGAPGNNDPDSGSRPPTPRGTRLSPAGSYFLEYRSNGSLIPRHSFEKRHTLRGMNPLWPCRQCPLKMYLGVLYISS